jgi:hypothetical protein
MTRYALLVLILASFSAFSSYGQVYERIYEVSSSGVQNRINENKIAGVAILSGIFAQHTIGLADLTASKLTSLENLLTAHPEITSFSVSEDLKVLTLHTQAIFTKESFIELTQPLGIPVTGYAASYTVND